MATTTTEILGYVYCMGTQEKASAFVADCLNTLPEGIVERATVGRDQETREWKVRILAGEEYAPLLDMMYARIQAMD